MALGAEHETRHSCRLAIPRSCVAGSPRITWVVYSTPACTVGASPPAVEKFSELCQNLVDVDLCRGHLPKPRAWDRKHGDDTRVRVLRVSGNPLRRSSCAIGSVDADDDRVHQASGCSASVRPARSRSALGTSERENFERRRARAVQASTRRSSTRAGIMYERATTRAVKPELASLGCVVRERYQSPGSQRVTEETVHLDDPTCAVSSRLRSLNTCCSTLFRALQSRPPRRAGVRRALKRAAAQRRKGRSWRILDTAILTNLTKYQWYTHLSRTDGADLSVVQPRISRRAGRGPPKLASRPASQRVSCSSVPTLLADLTDDIPEDFQPYPGYRSPDGKEAKATQEELLLWIHSDEKDLCWETQFNFRNAVAGHMAVARETPTFIYRNSLDLTGFIDGTGNPAPEDQHDRAIVPEGKPGAGGSFCIAQRWVHDLAYFRRDCRPRGSGEHLRAHQSRLGPTRDPGPDLPPRPCRFREGRDWR